MRKLIGILALLCVITPVFADDDDDYDYDDDAQVVATTGVAARMTCDEMQAEIDKLNTQEDFDADDEARLEKLLIQQRAQCVKKARSRRASGGPRAAAVTSSVKADELSAPDTVEEASVAVASAATSTVKRRASASKMMPKQAPKADADTVEEVAAVTEEVAEPVQEIDPAEQAAKIAANIAAGLCADGTKPNKFGCCAGETYKDLGNLQFACCPDDGGDCFPPINEVRALL